MPKVSGDHRRAQAKSRRGRYKLASGATLLRGPSYSFSIDGTLYVGVSGPNPDTHPDRLICYLGRQNGIEQFSMYRLTYMGKAEGGHA